MAKHRKTRREKKIADIRHSLYHLEIETPQEVKKSAPKREKLIISRPEPVLQNQSLTYAYVAKDLRKTIFITTIIFVTQIVLFYVLNRV
jgi:hypothetical protein